jgi:hypothetical protein
LELTASCSKRRRGKCCSRGCVQRPRFSPVTMNNYPSMFSQRQDKELAHGLYSPAAAMAQTNIYSSTIPTMSGLSSSVHGLSIYPNTSRGVPAASQFVSRSTTAPAAAYGGMGLGAISLGAHSPPPNRGGVIPMGIPRSGLMGLPDKQWAEPSPVDLRPFLPPLAVLYQLVPMVALEDQVKE